MSYGGIDNSKRTNLGKCVLRALIALKLSSLYDTPSDRMVHLISNVRKPHAPRHDQHVSVIRLQG